MNACDDWNDELCTSHSGTASADLGAIPIEGTSHQESSIINSPETQVANARASEINESEDGSQNEEEGLLSLGEEKRCEIVASDEKEKKSESSSRSAAVRPNSRPKYERRCSVTATILYASVQDEFSGKETPKASSRPDPSVTSLMATSIGYAPSVPDSSATHHRPQEAVENEAAYSGREWVGPANSSGGQKETPPSYLSQQQPSQLHQQRRRMSLEGSSLLHRATTDSLPPKGDGYFTVLDRRPISREFTITPTHDANVYADTTADSTILALPRKLETRNPPAVKQENLLSKRKMVSSSSSSVHARKAISNHQKQNDTKDTLSLDGTEEHDDETAAHEVSSIKRQKIDDEGISPSPPS